MSASDTETVRSLLIKAYQTLPPLEQVIVQLFSVIYEPISRASFINCWNHLSEKIRAGQHFTNPSIKPYIDRLLNVGVLAQQNGFGPQCNLLIAEIATRDAIQARRFDALVQAAEQGFPSHRRWKDGPISFTTDYQLLRHVRIAIYRNDAKLVQQLLTDYYKYTYQKDKLATNKIFQQVCNNTFDPEWFCSLPPDLYENA